MKRTILTALLLAVCCAATGCISGPKTKLTQVWRDDAYGARPAGKVLVIALARTVAAERTYEEVMAARLVTRGVDAVQGVNVIPAGTKLDRPTLRKLIEGKGIDLVLLTRLVSVGGSSDVVEGGPAIIAKPLGEYWGYSVYVLDTIEIPDTVDAHVVADLETRVYETAAGKMVWSAVSKSVNPRTERDVVDQVCDAVVRELARSRLIP